MLFNKMYILLIYTTVQYSMTAPYTAAVYTVYTVCSSMTAIVYCSICAVYTLVMDIYKDFMLHKKNLLLFNEECVM